MVYRLDSNSLKDAPKMIYTIFFSMNFLIKRVERIQSFDKNNFLNRQSKKQFLYLFKAHKT